MKRDAQKAILAAAGRYVRKLFGEFDVRLKAVETRAADLPALIERALGTPPVAKDGRDGIDGRDGERGSPGAPGEKGDPGEPGKPGRDGVDGTPGRDGVDGKSVTVAEVVEALDPRIETAIAKAALDFERRAQGVLERAIAAIPKPADGKDGRDGFSLDDLTIDDDGDGTITLRFARGDLVREKAIRYPRGDRGVFQEGGKYRKGDGATFGGSFWIAQKDAPEGRPGLSDDWRLAVKKGRDGRDGRDGIDKTAPVKVG